MATIFSKIVNGEIPCHKIAKNHEFFAFLDIHPLVEGHTLVTEGEEEETDTEEYVESSSENPIFAVETIEQTGGQRENEQI